MKSKLKSVLFSFSTCLIIFMIGACLHDFFHLKKLGNSIIYTTIVLFTFFMIQILLFNKNHLIKLEKKLGKIKFKHSILNVYLLTKHFINKQKYLNFVSVYSFILCMFSIFVGYWQNRIFPIYLEWLNLNGEPLPALTDFFWNNHIYFTVIFIVTYLTISILGIKQGTYSEVGKHLIMIMVISQLLYFSFLAVGLILPIYNMQYR